MSQQLAQFIEEAEPRFKEIAPKHLNYASEKGFAIQLLKNNSFIYAAAMQSPASLQQAITNVAAIGLSLNPAEKLAYLIPRNIKVDEKKWEQRVFLEPSYMGLCKLATDSGSIKWVQARCVYSEDTFTDNGIGEMPTHTYSPFASSKERGEFVGVYCVAKTADGDALTTTMNKERIDNIKGRSESFKKGYGPWVTDFEEQAKKTVIRNASKTWPKTNIHFVNAVELSNQNEGFDPILTEPKFKDFNTAQKEYFDKLIENGDALGMFVFSETIDYPVFTNLYHSFTKGTKGKFQRVIDDLRSEGQRQFIDVQDSIIRALDGGDDIAVNEILGEQSDDLIGLLKDKLVGEHAMMLDECLKQAA